MRQLCNKGVVLVDGRADFIGSSEDAIARYTQDHVSHTGEVEFKEPKSGALVHFTRARLLKNGQVNNTFFIGDSLTVEADAVFEERVRAVQVTFVVRSATEGNIYHCSTRDACLDAINLSGRVKFRATLDSLALYPGQYFIDKLWVATLDGIALDYITDVLSFEVADGGPCVHRRLDPQFGLIYEVPTWTLETRA